MTLKTVIPIPFLLWCKSFTKRVLHVFTRRKVLTATSFCRILLFGACNCFEHSSAILAMGSISPAWRGGHDFHKADCLPLLSFNKASESAKGPIQLSFHSRRARNNYRLHLHLPHISRAGTFLLTTNLKCEKHSLHSQD